MLAINPEEEEEYNELGASSWHWFSFDHLFYAMLRFKLWVVVADTAGQVRSVVYGNLSTVFSILMFFQFQLRMVVADIPGPVRRRSVFYEGFHISNVPVFKDPTPQTLSVFLFLFDLFILFAFFVIKNMGGT